MCLFVYVCVWCACMCVQTGQVFSLKKLNLTEHQSIDHVTRNIYNQCKILLVCLVRMIAIDMGRPC